MNPGDNNIGYQYLAVFQATASWVGGLVESYPVVTGAVVVLVTLGLVRLVLRRMEE